MKKLLFTIFIISLSCVLYLYGRGKSYRFCYNYNFQFDSLTNTYNVNEFQTSRIINRKDCSYAFPYVVFNENAILSDSDKWFASMIDINETLDSLSHEKKSEMFIWKFYHKVNYDHFMIYYESFTLARLEEDKMYGGFIINGKPFIIILEDSLVHRQEIEDMFTRRSDSIRVNIKMVYDPDSIVWLIMDNATHAVGVYQDSLLIPYWYTRENNRIYYLNDSIAKYLPD